MWKVFVTVSMFYQYSTCLLSFLLSTYRTVRVPGLIWKWCLSVLSWSDVVLVVAERRSARRSATSCGSGWASWRSATSARRARRRPSDARARPSDRPRIVRSILFPVMYWYFLFDYTFVNDVINFLYLWWFVRSGVTRAVRWIRFAREPASGRGSASCRLQITLVLSKCPRPECTVIIVLVFYIRLHRSLVNFRFFLNIVKLFK